MYLQSLISINLWFYEHQKCPSYFFNLITSSVVIAPFPCHFLSLLMVAVGAMSQGTMTVSNLSRDMRFPTMWYVRPAKAQTSLRIRAV